MKTNKTNNTNIILVNYDANMHLRWLVTDSINTSLTTRPLFTGNYDITNPAYSSLVEQVNIYIEQVEIDIAKIKEYIKNELKTITDEGVRIARQKQLKSIEAREKQDKQESNKTNNIVRSIQISCQHLRFCIASSSCIRSIKK